MQRLRMIVLACRWETIPPGISVPPPISLPVLRQMFSESPASDWSIADFHVRSTFGQVRFDPALVFDIGALPGTLVNREQRAQLIGLARQAASNQGIQFGPHDHAVVFINPPPCNAGALGVGGDALFDQAPEHTYFAHELGHVIGYEHSYGFGLPGSQPVEYGDPYCMMSAWTFGGQQPQASGPPAGATLPAGLPALMWNASGPLSTAAQTYGCVPDFAVGSNVSWIPYVFGTRVRVLLSALGQASANDVVLVGIDAPTERYFIEYRTAAGWDQVSQTAIRRLES